jgi:2-iminoacetate synthase ThiH
MAFVEKLQKEEMTEDKMRYNDDKDDEVEDTRVTQAFEAAAHHGDAAFFISRYLPNLTVICNTVREQSLWISA